MRLPKVRPRMLYLNTLTKEVPLPFPHSPMVCVKLPKTVLVLFHLFRATKLPIFPGRVFLALGCPFCVGQGSLLSMSSSDSARCLIRIGPRGTSTPNLPRRANHPRVGTGVRRSKSKGSSKIFLLLLARVLLQSLAKPKAGWPLNCSPQTGVWAEPQFHRRCAPHF